MTEILLTTLNAKYIHASFGLRYLLANLGELRPRAAIAEFDINQRPLEIVERLVAQAPAIIGFGVYIWNVTPTTEVVRTLRRLRPETKIILGGPEVSFETESQEIVQLADHVITGEADLAFGDLCRRLVKGDAPAAKIIAAPLPDLNQIALPYDLYNDDDVAHRVIYVEASRGCPFTCEFCLSSLDVPVRQFPLPALLEHLQRLLDRGVRQFKFVDRTFNLNLNTSQAILNFFFERYRPGLFVHFEMIPDRLPEGLRASIARFPSGALQFEVGIQTFDPEVSKRISRRQDYRRLADNFHFLHGHTGVHVHADLIAGLPGEDVESFAAGFDRLIQLKPQEIQVGMLKRLRGTPIARHDREWRMVYSPNPPYEVLETSAIDFPAMQRLRRFARYWDLVGNSGNFVETTPLLWSAPEAMDSSFGVPPSGGGDRLKPGLQTPFAAFMRWSDWLYARVGRQHSIALTRLAGLLFEFLTCEVGHDPQTAAQALWRDYQRGGRHDKPGFLKEHLPEDVFPTPRPAPESGRKRQARHLDGSSSKLKVQSSKQAPMAKVQATDC